MKVIIGCAVLFRLFACYLPALFLRLQYQDHLLSRVLFGYFSNLSFFKCIKLRLNMSVEVRRYNLRLKRIFRKMKLYLFDFLLG